MTAENSNNSMRGANASSFAGQREATHKVFPRTYLNRIVLSISFNSLSESCYPALIQFIQSTFNLEVTKERLENIESNKSPLRFNSSDGAVEWRITNDEIRVDLKKGYISFDLSLCPIIDVMKNFLINVNQSANEIWLEKINIIPVSLKSYKDLEENAATIFSEKILMEWDKGYYQKDQNSLLYQTTIKNEIEASIISGFISKEGLEEGQLSRYILDISAEAIKNIDPIEIIETSRKLNDVIFNIFLESITDLIVRSMEEE